MSTTADNGAPRARRYRSLPEKLGSVVLGFEAIVVFLAGLTIYGLRALPEQWPQWWGILAGALVAGAMIALSGMLRHRWAIAAGWVLQVVTLAGAFVVPAIVVLGVVFGGMWAYATIVGGRIEKRLAAERDASDQPLS